MCSRAPVSNAKHFRGADVVEVLERVGREVGFPAAIQVDHSSEFVSRDLDLWAYQRGVLPAGEALNAHWFLGLADAREKMEDWRKYYTWCDRQ
jgi:putative transposase